MAAKETARPAKSARATKETASPTKETARLKTRYESEIRPSLLERFGYSSPMQAPAIEKITLNMGVGDGKQDSKVIGAATDQLATIAGQRPSVRRARKSVANFKLREGMPVGVSVTLRGERSYEFLDRLMSIAIPRIRDFRGLSPRSFDGRGNYSMGVREQIIFPEIDYDAVDQVRGLDITITTSAKSDAEAFALLEAFGFPFSQEGRPRLPGDPEPEAPAPPAAAAAVEAAPDAEAASTNGHAAAEVEDATGEVEAAGEAEAEAQSESEPESEPAAEAEPEVAPDAEAQPEAEPAAEATAEPEVAPDAEEQPEPAPAPEPALAPEAEAAPEPEPATADAELEDADASSDAPIQSEGGPASEPSAEAAPDEISEES
jgi:large subunit ribosomal protein L5